MTNVTMWSETYENRIMWSETMTKVTKHIFEHPLRSQNWCLCKNV